MAEDDFDQQTRLCNFAMASNGFGDAESFYEAALRLTKASDDLLRRSGVNLGLNTDPFRLAIRKNRQLKSLNENAYSDWFAWVLENACRSISQPRTFCLHLFSANENTASVSEFEVPTIEREIPVAQGHEDHKGRLDLLINFSDLTWHIEVKRNKAEGADLIKNIGYKVELDRQYKNCRHILLVTDHQLSDYDGFLPLKWEVLCVRMRSWVAKEPKPGLAEGMLLFFCAIVEQCLLGMNEGTLCQMEYIENLLETHNERK